MRPSDFSLSPALFPRFAPGQEKAIRDLSESFSRFDLEIAPTGSGKTVINCCAARLKARKRFLYLVSTKALEDQVTRSLGSSGMIGIRGHRNYPCATRSTTDDGFECGDRRGCHYKSRLENCLLHDSVTTNYAHWINIQMSSTPDRLGAFDVLICDECHNLRDIICDQVGFTLTDYFLSSLAIGFPRGLSSSDMANFLSTVRRKISSLDKPNPQQSRLSEKISLYLSDYSSHHWVHEQIAQQGRRELSLEFKPVWPLEYAEQFVFLGIPKIILSSATIHPEEMVRLGIPASDLSVITVPSTFPASRRPIVYYNIPPKIHLKSSSSDSQRRFILNRIDTLVEHHSNVRGIVQCTSYDWAKQIEQQSRCASRYISHANSRGLSSAMEEFESFPPAVGKFLLSPSIKEGIDLSYDLCRAIIVPKVPFIDVRSPLHAERQSEDALYRNRETARILEQACGRGMRRANDSCATYILDGQWTWFHRIADIFSPHFKDAFRVSDSPINLARLEAVK